MQCSGEKGLFETKRKVNKKERKYCRRSLIQPSRRRRCRRREKGTKNQALFIHLCSRGIAHSDVAMSITIWSCDGAKDGGVWKAEKNES